MARFKRPKRHTASVAQTRINPNVKFGLIGADCKFVQFEFAGTTGLKGS